MDERSIACDLEALTAEERRRRERLVRQLRDEVDSVRRLDRGREFTFAESEERADRLGELVDLERRCCPFLDFALSRDGERVRLIVTGRVGIGEFLARTFGGATIGPETTDGKP